MINGAQMGQAEPLGLFENKEKSLFCWKSLVGGLLASSAAVIFGVAVILLSLLAVSNPIAVHPSIEEAAMFEEMDATSASLAKIEYYLPYPGLLPDSQLYKVKALRDRIALWLTFGGEKKAKRELLYADKRINAAIFLVKGGKYSLGISTATKAEKYLESAMGRAVTEAKAGRDVKSFLMELSKAGAKHLEVLKGLIEMVGTNDRQPLVAVYATTKLAAERVDQTLREAK